MLLTLTRKKGFFLRQKAWNHQFHLWECVTIKKLSLCWSKAKHPSLLFISIFLRIYIWHSYRGGMFLNRATPFMFLKTRTTTKKFGDLASKIPYYRTIVRPYLLTGSHNCYERLSGHFLRYEQLAALSVCDNTVWEVWGRTAESGKGETKQGIKYQAGSVKLSNNSW